MENSIYRKKQEKTKKVVKRRKREEKIARKKGADGKWRDCSSHGAKLTETHGK